MVGIVSYGAYIPYCRLTRAEIAAALNIAAGQGERSVASYDEDTATMAVEAARNCLAGRSVESICTLTFATTRPPYQEKLNSATIHAALQLPPATCALDLAGSVRSGFAGLVAASNAVHRGGQALATMSDIRYGLPESRTEQEGGDGAAAFLLGSDQVIAEIEGVYSETLEHLSTWRLPGEVAARHWEERFALQQAYLPLLSNAAQQLLERAQVDPSELSKVVIDAPNPRAVTSGLRQLGLDADRLVDPHRDSLGHTGTANAGLILATALDHAQPGERIAVFSVSDGIEAILLRATDAIAGFQPRRSVEQLLAAKRADLSYQRYLKWRGLLVTEPPRRPDPDRPAAPPSLRASAWKFGFVGSRCRECGTNHLPPQIVCVKCRASGVMEPVPFAERAATITTFTVDRIVYTPQPPMVSAILDFEGGGRFQCEMTDCVPEDVEIGQHVEMTFRRLYTAGGVHNYFWKCRPTR